MKRAASRRWPDAPARGSKRSRRPARDRLRLRPQNSLAQGFTSAAAEADADEIWFWIAAERPRAADALVRSFDEASSMLAEFPNAGPARDDLAPGLRSFAVYPYVLFYRPITGGIEVVRVLDGRRNITPDLF
ncbi:type II toxin-antitoxin system RelE/ParE family toxin [Caulobacter sp. NIBR1757]|uniref:type II toxin-antitoxin system RelE/ParE family toxin n=1 Tax=Caulobacter sp. NIBR1757 TaxID=3016000 RepID=UPI0022F00549|nr:type II toxin-antitoxin system RelE/ParE family toxin [Caulobacter sp. NIBR1757]